MTPDALAKSAREKLALALNALQTSPDTPVDLLDLAEPIAQTMGILHRIERSQGKDLSGRDQVLANIRSALNSLQTMTESHPAIDAVMEQVAGCLASAHQLARYESPAPVVAAPAGLAPVVPTAPGGVASVTANIPPPQPAPQPVVHADPFTQPAQVVPAAPHVPSAPIVPLGGTHAMPQPTPNMQHTVPLPPAPPPGQGPSNTVRIQGDQVREIAQAKALAAQQAHIAQQQEALRQAHEESARQQAQQQQYAAQQAMQAKQAPAQAFQNAAAPQPAVQSSRPAASAAGQSGNVIVELGTHSISNFYKGLGGNDVIEAGGIFVGTYKIPKLGAQVNLRVCLPGDYEFQATGTVQWIREPSHSGEGAEPGFGARFTQITPEGRQLVYRYTRNREPMFYDDL